MSAPRQLIVAAASGKPVISHAYYPFIRIHNTRTNLSRRVFRSHSRKKCNCHKIVIPKNRIGSFLDFIWHGSTDNWWFGRLSCSYVIAFCHNIFLNRTFRTTCFHCIWNHHEHCNDYTYISGYAGRTKLIAFKFEYSNKPNTVYRTGIGL